MRVPEQLQVLYLPLDLPDHVEVLDLLPVEYLDRDLVAGLLVVAHLHLHNSKLLNQVKISAISTEHSSSDLKVMRTNAHRVYSFFLQITMQPFNIVQLILSPDIP